MDTTSFPVNTTRFQSNKNFSVNIYEQNDKGERGKMLTVNIPDNLTNRIHDIAKSCCQTAEEFIIETLQDRIDHASAYSETEYLAQSATNKERLNRAVQDIQSGKYEAHELLND
jgi:predicted transcriptional regulator